jgi:hypothetical protein
MLQIIGKEIILERVDAADARTRHGHLAHQERSNGNADMADATCTTHGGGRVTHSLLGRGGRALAVVRAAATRWAPAGPTRCGDCHVATQDGCGPLHSRTPMWTPWDPHEDARGPQGTSACLCPARGRALGVGLISSGGGQRALGSSDHLAASCVWRRAVVEDRPSADDCGEHAADEWQVLVPEMGRDEMR